MKSITVEGQKREAGKSAKALRAEERIPANIYGGKGDNISFSVQKGAMQDLMRSATLATADIKIDDNNYNCIIKELQFHPVSDDLLHADFQLLEKGHEVKTEIPVQTVGRSKGVIEGGKMMIKKRKVKVKAKPENLIEFIEIDVTPLTIGQSVRISDLLEAYPDMQFLHHESIPVVSVQTSRVSKTLLLEEETTAEEGVEGAEGEEGAEGAEGEGGEGGEDNAAEGGES